MKRGTDCLVVQPIAESGLHVLEEAGIEAHVAVDARFATLRTHLATARAVITRNHGLSAREIGAAPELRIVVSHGTGVDAIDRDAAKRRGIPVVSTPGANAQAVAEHAFALMLACAKSVVDADRAVRACDHDFRFREGSVELAGRTLGLVGYGRIARRAASLGQAFGMRVIAHSRYATADEMTRDGVGFEADLNGLLARSDIISLHTVPGRGMVLDASRLALLAPHAILVNTARGALLDEGALAAALQQGRLRAAALDVVQDEPLSYRSPLMNCPRLILTPHIGGSAKEALDRTSLEAAQRVVEALGECPPEAKAEREDASSDSPSQRNSRVA